MKNRRVVFTCAMVLAGVSANLLFHARLRRKHPGYPGLITANQIVGLTLGLAGTVCNSGKLYDAVQVLRKR